MGILNWFMPRFERRRNFDSKKYEKLVKMIIKKSFPSLKNKPLTIKELNNSRYTAMIKSSRSKIVIRISPRMDTYTDYLNKGVLAHELGHMEDWCNTNWFNFYFLRDFKNLFNKYIREEEIRADKIMIQRGYARSLYPQRKKRFLSKNPKDKTIMKNYWSHNEIKSYAISIGKW